MSGGKDPIIEVRQLDRQPQDNAEALLLGHTATISSLSVSEDGHMIVSGSWDQTARIWQVGNWEKHTELSGHTNAVNDVLAYDEKVVITGMPFQCSHWDCHDLTNLHSKACADSCIRVFDYAGKLMQKIAAKDIVRALCKVPKGYSSSSPSASFASASNDGLIRLWTLEGVKIAEFPAHDSFVYHLDALPTGEIASASEDRTVRIWKNNECVQTITHPAISVWSVAACRKSGDIVTGASDCIVRVFSRSPERQTSPQAIQDFEDSIKSSAIPKEQVDGLDERKLPGPEFLQQKSGTKEGQRQLIKEANGEITAYEWSSAAKQWIAIGTVVGSAGSSGRTQSFQGQDYDYVFDVDIEDGKPPLKLPFNVSQNPYDVAKKFIANNELPVSYLDQVANFIISNSSAVNLGQAAGSQTQAPGSDPWGSESRYRPGEVGAPAASQPRAKVLPQTQYQDIVSANLKGLQKKIQEFNQGFIDSGAKDNALNPDDLAVIATIIQQLERAQSPKTPLQNTSALERVVELAVKLATTWPAEKQLPGTDLICILAASCPLVATYTGPNSETIVDVLSPAFANTEKPNHALLATRGFVNLFNTEEGRLIMDGQFDQVHELLKPYCAESKKWNRSLISAIATVFINYTVMLSTSTSKSGAEPPSAPNADRALTLLDDTTKIINSATDSEALYRSLVAAGTLLTLGDDFRSAAREVFDLEQCLAQAEAKIKEPRIKSVVAEMRDELKG